VFPSRRGGGGGGGGGGGEVKPRPRPDRFRRLERKSSADVRELLPFADTVTVLDTYEARNRVRKLTHQILYR
jgi:hypothetical protein